MILITVPTFENIYPDTFKSIYDLDRAGQEVCFEYVRGYDVATARNKIAKMALRMKAEYVLMVDNDTILPHDALVNLLDDAKMVNLGFYAHRGGDNKYSGRTNICRLYNPDGKKYFNYPLESEYTADEVAGMQKGKVEVHGGGMGCALIKTDVFEFLKYPWFEWVQYKTGKMLSEDLFFCEKCKKKGIKIYADTRVTCGHIFRYVQAVE